MMMAETPPDKPPLTLDMGEALAFLEAACRIASDLDGVHTHIEPRVGGQSNRRRAEQSSALLHGADLCKAAGVAFTLQYWALKGQADPREVDDL